MKTHHTTKPKQADKKVRLVIAGSAANNTSHTSGVSKPKPETKSKKSKSVITVGSVVRQISLTGLNSEDASANRLSLRRYVWRFCAESRAYPLENRVDRLYREDVIPAIPAPAIPATPAIPAIPAIPGPYKFMYKPLSEEEEAKADAFFARVDKSTRIGDPLLHNTVGLLQTLKNKAWLCSAIFDSYAKICAEKIRNDRVCILDAWYALYSRNKPTVVRNQKDIEKHGLEGKDLVLVPAGNDVHWVLMVINFESKKIEFYNSMEGGGEPRESKYFAMLKTRLENTTLDYVTKWPAVVKDAPQQEDAYNCGVFVCQFMRMIAQNKKVDSIQAENILAYRKHMLLDILEYLER